MKIAIVGAGIAGNVAAYRLRDQHDITVFESNAYVGGHTNTVDVLDGGQALAIDTGFIVFNDRTYPNFVALLDELGQESLASEMSFSVRAEDRDFEYCGTTIGALFAQRRNFLRPSFHRMIRDILRFNESMLSPDNSDDPELTLGELLVTENYCDEFRELYLVPMVAAIWSAEPIAVLEMPVPFLRRFLENHGLLQLKDRPQWRVIKGGSREYVQKLVAGHLDRIRLSSPVLQVRRLPEGVEVTSECGGTELFDAIFFACHGDQALALLGDPSDTEHSVLSAMHCQKNEAILHTDVSLMPKRKRAWAAWNYHVPKHRNCHVAVTYNMNILQRLNARQQYLVTLNHDSKIDEGKILRRIDYRHPIYSREMVAAQSSQADINSDRTYFCGAYWRNGFHEDGVVSALDAIKHFERRCADEELYLRRAG